MFVVFKCSNSTGRTFTCHSNIRISLSTAKNVAFHIAFDKTHLVSGDTSANIIKLNLFSSPTRDIKKLASASHDRRHELAYGFIPHRRHELAYGLIPPPHLQSKLNSRSRHLMHFTDRRPAARVKHIDVSVCGNKLSHDVDVVCAHSIRQRRFTELFYMTSKLASLFSLSMTNCVGYT